MVKAATPRTRQDAGEYRALTDLSLRKRPDPKCEDWHEWVKGEVFEPPPHMNIERCLERGIIEPVKGGRATAPAPVVEGEVANDGEV